jgi:hypothetical protein
VTFLGNILKPSFEFRSNKNGGGVINLGPPSSTIAKLQEGYDDYYSITSNEGALNSASAVLEDRLRQRGYKNKTWMVCGLKSFSIPRGGHRSCRRSFSRWPKLDVI